MLIDVDRTFVYLNRTNIYFMMLFERRADTLAENLYEHA